MLYARRAYIKRFISKEEVFRFVLKRARFIEVARYYLR